MSSLVPEGWNLRLAENFFVREKVKVTHDRNSVSERGSYPVIDQSEDGEIGFVDVLPEFDCSPQNPIVTFANHTCAVRKMTTPFGVIQNVFPLSSQVDSDVNFVYQALLSAIEPEGYKGHYPKLRETEFLTPPLPEQKKIASILTSVDEVIENTQKQIDKLQDLKKATMNELLTKGIGHTEFKDSELGRIPKSWEVRKVEEVSTRITDGEHQTPKRSERGYFLLSARNIRDGFISTKDVDYVPQDEFEKLSKRISPTEGDVLISCSGSVGRCALVPPNFKFAMVRSVAIVQPNRSLIFPEFLKSCIESELIQNQIKKELSQSAQPNLFQANIKRLRITVPSISEQKEIFDVLNAIQSKFLSHNNKLSQTQSLKKSLMQDLLTGKVRVTVN
ncbi:restriction endonuclease subunit S [Gammaproteobacteria bacterium]|nr:restriction endonuclease subunit S [Gammaproteobacteria bacterium]